MATQNALLQSFMTRASCQMN